MTQLCPHGCYWDCEHTREGRETDASVLEGEFDEMRERARLRAVTSADTMQRLRRCQECGEDFRDAVRHARDHTRMRQLGWLSREDSLR
jgi:hypothetical protein